MNIIHFFLYNWRNKEKYVWYQCYNEKREDIRYNKALNILKGIAKFNGRLKEFEEGIIEKKKIANTTNNDKPNGNTPTSSIIPQTNNSQSNITVPNQNLTTKNDATDLKIESLARSFSETIQSPISNEPEDTQEYENQQNIWQCHFTVMKVPWFRK